MRPQDEMFDPTILELTYQASIKGQSNRCVTSLYFTIQCLKNLKISSAALYNYTICCTSNESSIFLFLFRGFSFDGPYLCKFVENIPKINVVMPQIEMVEIVKSPSEIKTRNLNSMTRLRF